MSRKSQGISTRLKSVKSQWNKSSGRVDNSILLWKIIYKPSWLGDHDWNNNPVWSMKIASQSEK